MVETNNETKNESEPDGLGAEEVNVLAEKKVEPYSLQKAIAEKEAAQRKALEEKRAAEKKAADL